MAKKSGKFEMLEREKKIMQMIGQGRKRSEIASSLASQYRLTERAIEAHYDKIVNTMVETNRAELDSSRAKLIIELEDLQRKAYDMGNIKLTSELIEKKARLMGMYNPKVEEQAAPPKINIVTRDQGLKVVPKANNDD